MQMMLAVRGVSPRTGSSPMLNLVVRVLPVLLLDCQSVNQLVNQSIGQIVSQLWIHGEYKKKNNNTIAL